MANDLLLEAILVLEALRLGLGPRIALGFRDRSCRKSRASAAVSRVSLGASFLRVRAITCPALRRAAAREGARELRGDSPSTLLISLAPKPVKVRLCFGREMPAGEIPPCMSMIGAPRRRQILSAETWPGRHKAWPALTRGGAALPHWNAFSSHVGKDCVVDGSRKMLNWADASSDQLRNPKKKRWRA